METPKSYPQQDPPKSKNVITMDCRGLEFVDFKADVCSSLKRCHCKCKRYRCDANTIQGEWQAVGAESGTKFTGIDLTEGEWYDYDEKAGEEVSIVNVIWEIRRA